MTPRQLLKEATTFYLGSKDFNGYPCHHIRRQHQLTDTQLRPLLRKLLQQGTGALVFGDRHPNPHIRAFADEPAQQQMEKLRAQPLDHVCLYPTAKHLAKLVDRTMYEGKPYTLELALGAAQLEFRVFDLSVLEAYRNDPRYYYENNDINGRVCISDEYYLSPSVPEKDKVLLETFGFAYDDDFNRAVAVFCIYLNRLSPEHQQVWKSKEVKGTFKLHPDYFRNCILGDFGERMSVFMAFVEELRIINKMCDIMGRPHLFRETFHDGKPRNFTFLVRPTLEEYNGFVLTLDKMMSDNINKKFFLDDVQGEVEEQRDDGKIAVTPKGTISMLAEWLLLKWRPSDRAPMDELVRTFKDVRKQRQEPAHAVKEDVFDQTFFRSQRDLMMAAYNAVRTIRLIFANHPDVRVATLDIPDLLYKGEIWTF